MIPKIIHQSYKSINHPYPLAWQESWITNHVGWSYHFHSDEDNRALVQDQFSEFLAAFDAFPQNIMRADFARFLYLYRWGGIYVDLDYVCLKSFEKLIELIPRIGIPELPDNKYYQYHNALLISEAGNPFWLECASQAVQYFKSSRKHTVEMLAGPFRLQATIRSVKPNFTSLSAQHVTPIDWYSYISWGGGSKEVAALCRSLRGAAVDVMRSRFAEAYAITFWDHRWHESKQ